MAERPARAKNRNVRYGLKFESVDVSIWSLTQVVNAEEVNTTIINIFVPTHANTTFVLLFLS